MRRWSRLAERAVLGIAVWSGPAWCRCTAGRDSIPAWRLQRQRMAAGRPLQTVPARAAPPPAPPWTPGTQRWAHRRSLPHLLHPRQPAAPAARCPGSTLNTGLMSRTRAAGRGASPWCPGPSRRCCRHLHRRPPLCPRRRVAPTA